MKLNQYIDHTNLKPDSTANDIEQLCREAIEYEFAAVCILPNHIKQTSELLAGTAVDVCTVVGFPLGSVAKEVKELETKIACEDGAKEIDTVINISDLKAGNHDKIFKELVSLREICSGFGAKLKVIVETCLLTEEEKITITKIVSNSGADYIKTSTGFSKAGATVSDVRIFKKYGRSDLKIKAAGGIRTKKFALELIEAGANRIGTSSGVDLVKD
jgi:deoxyribose-phosphate aldolase